MDHAPAFLAQRGGQRTAKHVVVFDEEECIHGGAGRKGRSAMLRRRH
jgi:hypothetical protein